MSKLAAKISFPIVLAGVFVLTIFIALDYNRFDPNFYVILILLTLFMFFFGFATGQNLSSPIKKLLDKANELKNGNLSSRMYLETKDELADLARVFNQIAEEMETRRNAEESKEKEVDIKVRARTQELNETIDMLEQKVKNRTIEHERLLAESEKLLGETKNKEKEMSQLKQELTDLKSKLNKQSRQKVEESDNTNGNNIEGA